MMSGSPTKGELRKIKSEDAKKVKKVIRVLMNGCFDLLHAGHYNALRQSKFIEVGDDERVHLVAGVI